MHDCEDKVACHKFVIINSCQSVLFGSILSSIVGIISSRAKGFISGPQFVSNEIAMPLTSPLWGSETVRRKMLEEKQTRTTPQGPQH